MLTVIFDMDGVIFDSERTFYLCWQEVMDRYGFAFSEKIYDRTLGLTEDASREVFFSEYGQDFPIDDVRKDVLAIYRERYDNGSMPVKKGAEALLRALCENGAGVALASSTYREDVIRMLDSAGLTAYFRKIITGEMVTRSKPAPDIFLLAAKELGAEPDTCYVIEDSYNGIRAAEAAGMKPLMVPDMLPPTEEMRAMARGIFRDLCEVREYFFPGTAADMPDPAGRGH